MPKKYIDYSNTIIYKIYCKDNLINDTYVGHTTNFTKRKYQHKYACLNNTNLKLYNTIRANGGWENWDMIEISKYNCKDANEARLKEHEHYLDLNSSLNSCPPNVNKEKYYCSLCDVQLITNGSYIQHLNTTKHTGKIKLSEANNNMPNLNLQYYCEKCVYGCVKKSSWTQHILTTKHINSLLGLTNVKKYTCTICNLEFKHQSSLSRHSKTCKEQTIIISNKNIVQKNDMSDKDIIMMIVKQNAELIEILKKRNQ